MLGLRQFNRWPGERRLERLHDIARRSLLPVVTAVERLYPDKRRRFSRAPIVIARSSRHACDRDLVGQRQIGQFVEALAAAIPNLDQARERSGGEQVRVRAMNRGDQKMIAVRRGFDRTEDRGLAERRDAARRGVDQRELRRGVVFVELLVVRVAQQILERRGGRGFAVILLHGWPHRHGRRGGRRSATRDDSAAEQRLAVGHPLHRVVTAAASSSSTTAETAAAEGGVEPYARNAAEPAS